MKTQIGQKQIEEVLTVLDRANEKLGAYLSHEITDNGDFLVTLSKGKIRLYHVELLHAEKLLPFRCKEILERFRSSTG